MQEIASWHFDGNMEKATEAMGRLKYGMSKLYSLDDLPELPDEPNEDSAKAIVIAESKVLEGESVTFWSISDPDVVDPVAIPLPQWFKLPIDTIVLSWKREYEVWEDRKDKRHQQGKSELPPKSKLAYEKWLEATTKVLILDKKKQAVVKNPGMKSAATLRRTCLMLKVHPSIDANDLWIQAGDGKRWLLKLMRGENTLQDLDVPEEVDHFTGSCWEKHVYRQVCHIYIYIGRWFCTYVFIKATCHLNQSTCVEVVAFIFYLH